MFHAAYVRKEEIECGNADVSDGGTIVNVPSGDGWTETI